MDLIPDTLRRNNEDGNVVFFCGAGVSVPAGLPTFKELVRLILTDLLPSAEECTSGTTEALAWKAYKEDRYDEALGILETTQHGGFEAKKVRQKVIGYLSKRPKMLEHHLTLSQLADLDRENGRLVTTNFDDFFEKSQRTLCKQDSSQYKMPVFMSPALPPAKPETFIGLVYLHGKLGSSPNNHPLVLSTADFGMAYMLEGWGTSVCHRPISALPCGFYWIQCQRPHNALFGQRNIRRTGGKPTTIQTTLCFCTL